MEFYLIGFVLLFGFGLVQSKRCVGVFKTCPTNQKCNYDDTCVCKKGYKWRANSYNDCVKRRDYCTFLTPCSGLYDHCDDSEKKCSCIDGYKKIIDICVKRTDYCDYDDQCKKDHEVCSKHVCSCDLAYERINGVCKKMNKWKLIVIITIPLAFVACLAFIGFYIFRRMMIRRRCHHGNATVVMPPTTTPINYSHY